MDKKKLLAVAAVPAVLAFGAFGFAQQQNAAQASPSGQAQQAENSAADPDNIQQGDQTSPDKPGQAEEQEAKGPDTDNIQQGGGNQVEDGKPDLPGAPAEDGD
ncbi:MAG: hypothetical protein H0V83_08540 [Rubrobacter sp.]|nr:hypothetical protein [Rubrobacter sp.]